MHARSRSLRTLIIGTTLAALAACTGGADGPELGSHSQEAAATHLDFLSPPTDQVRNLAFSPDVMVQALDGAGEIDGTFSEDVTLAIGTNPGSGTLGGTLTVTATTGIAFFSGVSIDNAGVGYTLTASGGALPLVTSGAFTIVEPEDADHTQFGFTPAAATAATLFPVVVSVRGELGGIASTFNGPVTIAISTNPSGATLGGVTTVNAVNGTAVFSVSIDLVGAGYTLIATSPGLGTSFSGGIQVFAGTPTHFGFVQQPTQTVAGVAINPAVEVAALDAGGNIATSYGGDITVALGNNPGGGTLAGDLTVTATNGVAAFGDLVLEDAGVGYTLSAGDGSLADGTSAGFAIVGAAATTLEFTTDPGTSPATAALAPTPVVQARDPFGNLAAGFTGDVTLAIGTNPGGSTLSGTVTVGALGGIATFPGLSINKVGVGYTLTAAAAGVVGDTSNGFDIVAGTATHLVFTTQPSNALSQTAIAPAIVVHARDGGQNLATGFTGVVTLSLGANPGGTLAGTVAVNAVGGVATFADVSIGFAGDNYTLIASASGLTDDESATFDIEPGLATQLAFTGQPSTEAAGVAIAPAVVVQARDAFGNAAPSFTGSVTITRNSGPVLGTLSGTTSVNAIGGVATFSTLSLDRTGSYTLAAAASGLSGAISTSFVITAATATTLAFTVQPSDAAAGVAIAPPVVVTAFDGFGNLATGFVGSVTVSTNSGPGTLSGTTAVNAAGGVATFSTLSLDLIGSYTLAATATGPSGAVSGSFTIGAGAATELVFTAQPSNTTAGASITPAVQVTARDSFGNVATQFTGDVVVSRNTGPASGALSGTTTVAAVLGVATFSNLSLDKSGTYTLAASAAGLAGAASASFNIGHAAANHLAFTVSPSSATAGVAIAPAIVVEARDPFDNTASSFNNDITIAIGTNPGGGALTGTTTVGASGGDAAFALSIDKSGTGYTLTATAAGLTGTTSTPFNIVAAAADHLAYTVLPSTTVAGQSIAPAVQVVARDAFDNLATSFGGSITLAIGSNPGGATLGGTTPIAAVAGVATFGNLSLDKVGSGYTLAATAGGLTGATSTAFTITPAAATNLVFLQQPTTTVAGQAITPAVTVRAHDPFGNLDTNFVATIAIAIANNPGASTLGGTTSTAAAGGVASFANLTLNKVGTGYTLAASSAGLTGATSAGFDVTPAAPTHVAFSIQPQAVVAGVAIAPAVVVQARDAFENVATQFTGDVAMAIGTNPGGGSLTGTTSTTAIAGSATFGNLRLDKTGTGYTLVASSVGLTGATSASFNVTPAPASRMVYATNPSNTVAGVTISPAISLIALDPFDNVATTFNGQVSMAIASNPGASTLGGITTVEATAGSISFSTLTLNKVGVGYTLTATSTGLTSATSLGFNITPAAAAKLAFTVQPTSSLAGQTLTPPVQLVARDAFDNFAVSFNGQVTIAIGNNPGGSNLLGTATVTAVAGNITFDDLSLNRVGAGYTLSATSLGLAAATSATFDIVSGNADRLFFTVQPTSAVAGQALSPAVQLTVRDSLGNLATQFNGDITVSIFTNPGTATLAGTTTVAATAGVAQFVDLSLDKVGSGYTLLAGGAGLVSATSTVFNISSAAAASLSFSVQPSTVVAGAPIVPSVQVTARDPFGNQATGFTDDITVALGNNPGASTLGGTAVRTAVAGLASFPGLTLDKVGAGYTLTASASPLPTATSGGFAVTPAAPAVLVFSVEPTSTAAGDVIAPPVLVEARDAFDNLATQFTSTISIALGANPGGSTLTGTTTVNAVGGVATYANLSLDRAAAGYTLVATGGGMAPATSAAFEITPSNASRLVFTVQPADGTAGVALAPTIRVEARDPSGNLDVTFNGMVAIAIGTNPGTGTLMGSVSMAATAGQVAFADLAIDKAGAGYNLVASTAGLVSATSTDFDIAAAAADHLVFVDQPLDSTAGVALAPAVRVEARDAFDNLAVSFTDGITVAIGANPGTSTLGGTTTVVAVAGSASFANLSLDRVGAGYTLTAGSPGLDPDTSATFEITAAAASQLGFVVQPSNVPAGEIMTPAVTVQARDAFGNPALSFTGAITLAIGTNPGSSTLGGTTSVVAVAGLAGFADLTLDGAANGYTLTAAGSGLTGTTSTSFDVMPGSASRLAFTVEPSDALAGAALAPAVVVEAHDASGNLVPSFSGNVTLALGTNPGAATLAGTITVAAVGGVATFADLSLNRQASGYRLNASATGFASATSATFAINPAAAARLAVAQQPSDAIAATPIAPAVQIAAEDAFGNRVTTFTGAVTIALGANPGTATLSGTLTVTASSGIASFSALQLDRTGTGYTLVATSTGLTMVETDSFDVSSGTAASMAFTVQPADAVAGVAIAPAVAVAVLDSQGNVDVAFAGNVTVMLSANPGASSLSGTVSVLVANGVATFADLSLDKVGSGYTLAAAAAGIATATSEPFDVGPGAAATYVATGLAANTVAGASSAVVLTAHDAHGNVATGYAGTAALTSSDADVELPATVSFTAGVSASIDVVFHTVGTQTLIATDNADAAVTATLDTNVTAVDAPSVEITSPASGQRVGGRVTVTATGAVASTTTLVSLEILVDGVVIGTAATSPASAEWDATSLAIGSSHTLTARVTDAEGNVTTSAPVTVTISEAPDDGCGCRSSARGPGLPVLAGLVLLALLVPRRRRQAR